MNPAGTSARRNSAPRTTSVAHPGFLICRIPFIVVLILERLAQNVQGIGDILAFFGALRTRLGAVVADAVLHLVSLRTHRPTPTAGSPGQPIDIPKLSRSCMGVEKIVDSERGAPAPKKSVVSVEVGVAGVA